MHFKLSCLGNSPCPLTLCPLMLCQDVLFQRHLGAYGFNSDAGCFQTAYYFEVNPTDFSEPYCQVIVHGITTLVLFYTKIFM